MDNMDKRKQKSQKIIMDAFLELCKDKDFEKISMNDIAEKANVNRGTIYLNFADKYDLLNRCIEVNFSPLIAECREAIHTKKTLTRESIGKTFKYLENHYDFLQALFTNVGFSSFRRCFYNEIVKSLHAHYQLGTTANPLQTEVSIQFLASAVTGVLEWWFVNSMPWTSEQITGELWSLLQNNANLKLAGNEGVKPEFAFASVQN